MVSLTLMSLVTSVKDYVEITHKLIDVNSIKDYTELGALFSYLVISIGNVLKDFFSFSFLKNIWSIPLIIPDIASAMISEVSVLDGYFHNAFTFLETGVKSTDTIGGITILEKLFIGLINSFFLFLPTSTSHLITVRRFVMQGLEAGYIAGLGTLAGNFLWLASIILGWRFFVIPWLSFDIFRYLLGFILIVKYIWDSSFSERRMALEDVSKTKIFLLNFLLALTEQTCIYPFISNLSFGPEASIIEGFAVQNYGQFILVHGAYLMGILIGSFSLLQFTCWFWENPAFSIYIWITTKSSNKISTSSYYKVLNFTFLYCTMLCAIASIPYYGLDYTITNPIGLVPQDRILDQKKSQSDPDKLIPETAFLGVNPTDKNTRIRDGVHARRERWKQRLIKYQAYDASVYDQGVYDFLTVEDLNYGFDRFWLRRKMRNHQIRFRLFPGPWMRSLKKQLNKPANLNSKDENLTKSATGPRVDFFRILFEQFYHPVFHQATNVKNKTPSRVGIMDSTNNGSNKTNTQLLLNDNISFANTKEGSALISPISGGEMLSLSKQVGAQSTEKLSLLTPSLNNTNIAFSSAKQLKPGLIYEYSALRKFVRNFNKRTNLKSLNTAIPAMGNIANMQMRQTDLPSNLSSVLNGNKIANTKVYSKRWKALFSKIQPSSKTSNYSSYLTFRNISKQILMPKNASLKLTNLNQKMSQQDLKIKLNLPQSNPQISNSSANANLSASENQLTFLRPLSFYLQKEQAFKRKLRYYGATTMRKLTVGNQAPYFKTLMKRGFYYYKPSLRFKKTLYVASMRRGFRKKSRKQKNLVYINTAETNAQNLISKKDAQTNNYSLEAGNIGPEGNLELTPNHSSYAILNKRASRYRHQIYKDVLQHWYYTPFNRLSLKFDIDAFMNRQPKSYALTKNEERLLHVKRFLLAEHYDTLRWYTYMQHYNTMKNTIGGTKSFASRTYNQQFQGTFKKIRHLFAITPTQENFSILKFDQPLYNNVQDKNLIYFHEELLPSSNNQAGIYTSSEKLPYDATLNSEKLNTNLRSSEQNPVDIVQQSQSLIGMNYLKATKSNLLPATNTLAETYKSGGLNSSSNTLKESVIYNELLVKLIKECKRHIYDQNFLKNYITHRIDKREQRSQEQIKELNKRLEKLKTWLNFSSSALKTQMISNSSESKVVTNGIQKALNDSLFVTNNINPLYSNKPLVKVGASLNKFPTTTLQGDWIKTTQNIKAKLTILKAANSGELKTKINRLDLVSPSSLGNQKGDLTQTTSLIAKCKLLIKGSVQLAKTRTNKNLEWWRKKQRAVKKRKEARKRDRFKKQKGNVEAYLTRLAEKAKTQQSNTFTTLYGNYDIKSQLVDSKNLSKKVDSNVLRKKVLNNTAATTTPSFNEMYGNSIWEKFFMKKFRKQRSSKGRRYRSFSYGRYLTATRKPKLLGTDQANSSTDKLENRLSKLESISGSSGVVLNKQDKQQLITLDQAFTENLNTNLSIKDLKNTLKNAQINRRGRHAWKKQKRHNFNNSQNKYKKRQIQSRGKLRVMSKKYRKLVATHELRQWWWNSFLPRYYNNITINNGAIELAKDQVSLVNKSFKPLSKADLTNSSKPTFDQLIGETPQGNMMSTVNSQGNSSKDRNNFIQGNINQTTNLPFYAGWDESLRKFVVTNRFLSRRDAGLNIFNQNPDLSSDQNKGQFTNSPIQGLNEGSFLYSQKDIPFNSYNIDQFISTNQSFYAPLGWRRFEFRHSILKTWYSNYQKQRVDSPEAQTNIILNANTMRKMLDNSLLTPASMGTGSEMPKQNTILTSKLKAQRAVARRIKKRYKLLKQTPNQLMYNPTGPLLTEVLPSHYISVFDQQYRFPRNRYLKRNLLKNTKKTTLLAMLDASVSSNGSSKEFTLRKRVKPRRKYHRKRFIKKEGLIFPRRTKFTANEGQRASTVTTVSDEDLRWRPSSRSKQKRNLIDPSSKDLQAKPGSKSKANKRVKTNPLRLRQLRRREFQQILKPSQRYQPRNGGFTWPGDYLRLEVVELPKLKLDKTVENKKQKKTSLKQKINVQPVGIMPRKYLIEKHNILVLKKRLEKAHAIHQLPEVIKEYKLLIQNKI